MCQSQSDPRIKDNKTNLEFLKPSVEQLGSVEGFSDILFSDKNVVAATETRDISTARN